MWRLEVEAYSDVFGHGFSITFILISMFRFRNINLSYLFKSTSLPALNQVTYSLMRNIDANSIP